MDNIGLYIIVITIILLVSGLIAEFFGRGKHIGYWWTLSLLATANIIGLIALIASPSAKEKPPEGSSGHFIASIVFFILGIVTFFTLNPIGIGFIVLSAYLYKLSKDEIVNENPKFYFNGLKNIKSQSGKSIFQNENQFQVKEDAIELKENIIEEEEPKMEHLQNLKEKGYLSESEYLEKIKKFNQAKLQKDIEQLEEYHQLKTLYNSGYLTNEEFEQKILQLKNSRVKKEIKSATSLPLDSKLTQIGGFKEGLALVWDDEQNYGFINEDFNLVIPTKYEFAEDFNEGVAVARIDGKFGYINSKGKEVIPFRFTDANNFSGGQARVRKGGSEFIIDKTGNLINEKPYN